MVNNVLVEHDKLFLLAVEAFAPQLVVSKCALADKEKPPLCKGRWHGLP